MNWHHAVPLLMALVVCCPASAQTAPVLEYDASTQSHVIRYTGEDGIAHIVRWHGMDQVAPQVDSKVVGDYPFQYTFAVRNGATAVVSLFTIIIPCDSTASSKTKPKVLIRPPESVGKPYRCIWRVGGVGNIGPRPGEAFAGTLTLNSQWLPGLVIGNARGRAEPVYFEGFADESPEQLKDLVAQTETGKAFELVGPKYATSVFRSASSGIGALQHEIAAGCRGGAIAPEGTCTSLAAKLSNAGAAAARGDAKVWTDLLHAFTAELRSESGKHVNASLAGALLVDAEYLLNAIAP